MIIIHGDMSRDIHGRKRKKLPKTTKRKREFVEWRGSPETLRRSAESKKYPSAKMPPPRKPSAPSDFDAVKESKNFTIAPAYNKGAYQVIPNSQIESIGK